MSHFTIIFGTRPEFLKLKSLIDKFNEKNIMHSVIYVQQHVSIDEEMDNYYKLLSIDNNGERLCNIGQQILLKLPDYIVDTTHIIVQGDTATAFYSALCAFQLQKKIIHIEAGLRTYDMEKPFPEEAYRQMISRIANVHFTPHEDSSKILMEEKVSGKIENVGNTILDLVRSYELTCKMYDLIMITFHRRENWDKIDLLLTGLQKLVKKTPNTRFIWYLHHNPALQSKVREAIREMPSIEIQSPCNHREFTTQIARAKLLITDSGGIQEEASFLGKHCVVLRASTERSHIPPEYITVLEDYSRLDEIYEGLTTSLLPPCNVYGSGNSSRMILQNIKILYENSDLY